MAGNKPGMVGRLAGKLRSLTGKVSRLFGNPPDLVRVRLSASISRLRSLCVTEYMQSILCVTELDFMTNNGLILFISGAGTESREFILFHLAWLPYMPGSGDVYYQESCIRGHHPGSMGRDKYGTHNFYSDQGSLQVHPR